MQDKIKDKITDDVIVEETSKNVDTYKQESDMVVDLKENGAENTTLDSREDLTNLKQEKQISAQ